MHQGEAKMTSNDGSESPNKDVPAKTVLNDSGAEVGASEKKAEAVRRDTGAIDADAAYDRSS
jgi:hypothetical protein